MKRKSSLALCVVMVIMAFAATAFARYEPCPKCGIGRMYVSETSSGYDYKYTLVACKKVAGREDTKETYKVDELWVCTTSYCNEHFTETVTRTNIECNH